MKNNDGCSSHDRDRQPWRLGIENVEAQHGFRLASRGTALARV
jgi:hypothetical protein